MIGTNIPGTTSFYLNKQKQPGTIGSGPTAPSGTPPAGPATTTPTQQPQMAGYINTMAAKPPAAATPSPSASVLPTYTPPATQTMVQRANPTASVAPSYTPPVAQTPQAPQPPVTSPYPTPYTSPMAKAGAAGSTLQDPGQITDAGKAYAQRVTQNLQPGQNPLVQNAQATEDTAAARRGYEANKGTQERLAQTPFAMGSAQYQRAMDESQSTVNAANLAGQNNVNDFTRKTTADNLAAAKSLEDTAYGNAVGERTRTDLQGKDLSTSLPEGKARYAYNAMVAKGVSPQDAYNAVVGQSGEVNDQYKGLNPGQTEVQGNQQNAEAWVGATTDLQPGTKAYTEAVRQRMVAVDKATQTPLDNGVEANQTKAITGKLNNNEPLTPDEVTAAVKSGTIPPLTPQTIPFGDQGVKDFLKQHPSGKAAINGHVVDVVQGGRYTSTYGANYGTRHTDFAQLKVDGKDYWVDSKGTWYASNPVGYERNGEFKGGGDKAVKSPIA